MRRWRQTMAYRKRKALGMLSLDLRRFVFSLRRIFTMWSFRRMGWRWRFVRSTMLGVQSFDLDYNGSRKGIRVPILL
jgi:hypothetical protein